MDPTSTFLFESSKLFTDINPIFHQLRQKSFTEYYENVNDVDVDKTIACKWCLNSWVDGHFSIRLKPQKKKPSKLTLKKLSLEKSSKLKFNNLVMKCLVCKQVTKQKLIKNQSTEKHLQEQNNNEEVVSDTKIITQKKKKKKKDKYAGLNVSAVDSITKENKLNIIEAVNQQQSVEVKPMLNHSEKGRHNNSVLGVIELTDSEVDSPPKQVDSKLMKVFKKNRKRKANDTSVTSMRENSKQENTNTKENYVNQQIPTNPTPKLLDIPKKKKKRKNFESNTSTENELKEKTDDALKPTEIKSKAQDARPSNPVTTPDFNQAFLKMITTSKKKKKKNRKKKEKTPSKLQNFLVSC